MGAPRPVFPDDVKEEKARKARRTITIGQLDRLFDLFVTNVIGINDFKPACWTKEEIEALNFHRRSIMCSVDTIAINGK